MDLVRTRLRDRIHHARGVLAVLCRPRAGLDLELLQGIRKRHRQTHVVVRIVVGCSVEQVYQAVTRSTGHGNRGCRIIPDSGIVGVNTTLVRDSRKQYQLGDLPAIEGQFQHTDVIDHLTDGRGPRFNQGGIGLDLDGFGHLADLEHRIDHRIVVDLEHNSGLRIRAESRQRGFQSIWANRQVRQYIGSGFIGQRAAFQTGVGLGHADFHTGQNCSAWILDRSADRRRRLCPNDAAVDDRHEQAGECELLRLMLHLFPPPLRKTLVCRQI